jgi:5-methyltetrahydrofolate--homocysteine methyltransferase
MIIVGELINASRKSVKAAIESEDRAAIQNLANAQTEAGANYIDVNAGVFVSEEIDYLKWVVKNVLEAVKVPCCIDSPNPKAIEATLKFHRDKTDQIPMVNSISLESQRWEALLPIVSGTDLKVVALCMSDDGMPETAVQRLAIADKLINGLIQNNVKLENIFVDPLVQSIGTNPNYGREFLQAVGQIVTRFEGVHIMCGLSNISFGLPKRKFLNRTFMTMAIAMGMDGAILDPLDQKMMANIISAEALAGQDEYCGKFLAAYRKGNLDLD